MQLARKYSIGKFTVGQDKVGNTFLRHNDCETTMTPVDMKFSKLKGKPHRQIKYVCSKCGIEKLL